jgi:hypothetical protein
LPKNAGSREERKMDSEQVSNTVDRWVREDAIHEAGLVVIRKNSPWHGMSEEEIEDRREFIRCYINKDFEVILQIPVEPVHKDFWFSSHQEFMESAFNTNDFQKTRKPFDKYGYRVRKILERVKELALLHSCISQPEGRANIRRRYENLVDYEFRSQLLFLVGRHQRTFDEERRLELRHKIAKLNRRIFECEKVWERYALWEDIPSYLGRQSSA